LADDVVQVQSTGSAVQNIDNTLLVRPDGTNVDRQRVSLKNDLDWQQPATTEALLMKILDMQEQMLVEMRIANMLLQDLGLFRDDIDKLRSDELTAISQR
jgi:hypothetical protein